MKVATASNGEVKILTQKKLKEMVKYDRETGVFTALRNSGGHRKKGDIVGSKHNRGYFTISIYGKNYLAHRLAWLYEFNEMPDVIDHKNRNKKDNRISNLRNVSQKINLKNSSLRSDNKSGVNGVYYCKNRKKWVAGIRVNSKTIHLGRFNSKFRAIKERILANRKYGFTETHGREQC